MLKALEKIQKIRFVRCLWKTVHSLVEARRARETRTAQNNTKQLKIIKNSFSWLPPKNEKWTSSIPRIGALQQKESNRKMGNGMEDQKVKEGEKKLCCKR